jgi:hypothetical protein
MATILIDLQPGEEKVLRQKASAHGTTLESYILELVQREALTSSGSGVQQDPASLSLAEFDEVLDELAGVVRGAPSLPIDFSRTDIYADHD